MKLRIPFILILALGLLCLSLAGCGAVSAVGPNTAAPLRTLKTTGEWQMLEMPPEGAYSAGDEIAVRIPRVTDTSIRVLLNGAPLQPESEGEFLCFAFPMPDRDSELTVEARGVWPELPPEEDAQAPTSPPLLTLKSDGQLLPAERGSFSWQYDAGNGASVGKSADSPHPLDFGFGDPFAVTQPQLGLVFEREPDALSIRCWPETVRGQSDAEAEPAMLTASALTLKSGGWIYEVTAEWNAASFGGSATYFFFISLDSAA